MRMLCGSPDMSMEPDYVFMRVRVFWSDIYFWSNRFRCPLRSCSRIRRCDKFTQSWRSLLDFKSLHCGTEWDHTSWEATNGEGFICRGFISPLRSQTATASSIYAKIRYRHKRGTSRPECRVSHMPSSMPECMLQVRSRPCHWPFAVNLIFARNSNDSDGI